MKEFIKRSHGWMGPNIFALFLLVVSVVICRPADADSPPSTTTVDDMIAFTGSWTQLALGRTSCNGVVDKLAQWAGESIKDGIDHDKDLRKLAAEYGDAGQALVWAWKQILKFGTDVGVQNVAVRLCDARRVRQTRARHPDWLWPPEPPRSALRITIAEIDQTTRTTLGLTSGVLVTDVVPGGSGDQAGIHAGDIVLAINGHTVASIAEMIEEVGDVGVGARAVVRIQRGGHQYDVLATLGPAVP